MTPEVSASSFWGSYQSSKAVAADLRDLCRFERPVSLLDELVDVVAVVERDGVAHGARRQGEQRGGGVDRQLGLGAPAEVTAERAPRRRPTMALAMAAKSASGLASSALSASSRSARGGW